MATAQDIKLRILQYLNLLGQTTMLENDFFETAHKEIQRRHNFKCMEVEAYVTLATDTISYALPVLNTDGGTIVFKEPRGDARIYNATTSLYSGDIYYQTGHLDTHKLGSDDSAFGGSADLDYPNFFSIYRQRVFVHAKPTSALNGLRFVIFGWQWLTPPVGTATDWFTIHAADYLFYRAIAEAMPYLSKDIEVVKKWLEMSERAFALIHGQDVQNNWSGPPMRARG